MGCLKRSKASMHFEGCGSRLSASVVWFLLAHYVLDSKDKLTGFTGCSCTVTPTQKNVPSKKTDPHHGNQPQGNIKEMNHSQLPIDPSRKGNHFLWFAMKPPKEKNEDSARLGTGRGIMAVPLPLARPGGVRTGSAPHRRRTRLKHNASRGTFPILFQ